MALPLPFDTQGFPVVNAIVGGVAPGGSPDGPDDPGASVSTAVGVNVAVNIAATTDGLRYRVSIVGGEGICIRCDAIDPVVTNEPWYSLQKFEFTATVTSASGVRAIKRTAGTADATVIVTLLS